MKMTTSQHGVTAASPFINNDNEDRAQASAQIIAHGLMDQSITLAQVTAQVVISSSVSWPEDPLF